MIVDRTAIDRGIALLDEKVPDWLTKIDLEKLDIGRGDSCILGQIGNGDFINGLEILGINDLTIPMSYYGFDMSYESDTSYSTMTEGWIEAIKAKRQGDYICSA